jgi:hypothetical protein
MKTGLPLTFAVAALGVALALPALADGTAGDRRDENRQRQVWTREDPRSSMPSGVDDDNETWGALSNLRAGGPDGTFVPSGWWLRLCRACAERDREVVPAPRRTRF